MPIFSRAELLRRAASLHDALVAHDLDAVIVTSYAGFYYVTGVPIHAFGRPMAAIFPREGAPAIVESIIEIEHTTAHTWIDDIRTYYDYNIQPVFENPQPPPASLTAQVREVLVERGLEYARIGIEEAHLSVTLHRLWQAALPQAEFVPASARIDRLRLVLSAEEMALVRAADAIADFGQELLIGGIAPGRRAFDLVQEVRGAMVEECCRRHPDMPFHLHVDPGMGDGTKAAGHSEWTLWNLEDRVGSPQLLTTVISVWLWGYWGNIERSVHVGAATPEVRRAFDVMVEANETAIAAIRPGMRLADVDRTAKAVLARHGYPTRSGSGCGRGIVSYEGNARELLMDLRLYAEVTLEPGMAFSLEPDVHLPGVGTFRHCNTIIVTPEGCKVDSRLARDPIYV